MVVAAPGFQLEGAVADDVFGAGPGVPALADGAVLKNNVAGHRSPSIVFDDFPKIGRGAAEVEAKGVVIHDFHPDGGEIGGFALVEIVRAFEEVKHLGILRAKFGPEDALVRKREIMGGDGHAVGPFPAGPEFGGPDGGRGVRSDLQRRPRRIAGVALRVAGDEALKQSA